MADDSAPGLAARRSAVRAVDGVLRRSNPVEDNAFHDVEGRERSFAHALTALALRRKGEAEAVLGRFLTKPLPKSAGETRALLLTGAAQLLFMRVPAHAAIDQAVTLAKAGADSRHFAGLVNAVLRKAATQGEAMLAALDAPKLNTPAWLWARWAVAYGEPAARRIAESHGGEPSLDVTVKPGHPAPPGGVLPTGTVRLAGHAGRIEDLPGFDAGDWWVQDAAAAMPARLLGDVRGLRVLDLCAAPGGKTAQLAAAGARVTAVDFSAPRMARLSGNLARLRLEAETVIADALAYAPPTPFDAVLLDAPCSSTGTIRRHPDLPWIKSERQIGELAALQAGLLAQAATLVRPGGVLVFSTCSLEPEEGRDRIAPFLAAHPFFRHEPIGPDEVGGQGHLLSPEGDLRSLPHMDIGGHQGLDGFFAARLRRGGGC